MLMDDVVICANCTISEALKKMDVNAQQIIFIVDENNQFLGTVTDGDVRRGLLDRKSLSEPVSSIMNTSPIVMKQGEDSEQLIDKARQLYITKIPIIDVNNHVVDLYDVYTEHHQIDKNNAVILMAGGLGTRLYPMTEKLPKPLIEVGDKPILETIIKNFEQHGFKKIYISVNYKAEMIKDYFQNGDNFGVEIRYLEEKQRLGTAGALSLLDENEIDAPFFVMNGDLLTNVNFEKMLAYHLQNKSVATVGVREYDFQVPYGVIQSSEGYVSSIEEKPVHKFFVNTGIYLLDPTLLVMIPKETFFDMPALISMAIEQDKKVASFPVHEYWLDIGRIEEYDKANDEYKDTFL